MNETAKKLAEGEGFVFWKIGTEVFRAPEGTGMDTWGLPMGRRWECSMLHWTYFRDTVYAWARSVLCEVCGADLSTDTTERCSTCWPYTPKDEGEVG